MASSSGLIAVVNRLLAMPLADRDFVLNRLESEARQAVLQHIEANRAVTMSEPLRLKVASALGSERPEGMTARAADALALAGQAVQPALLASIEAGPASAGPPTLDRVLRSLGLRG